MGTVALDVSDLATMRTFYQRAIGLDLLREHDDGVELGVSDRPLVELVHRPGAPRKPNGTTGLFHLAILVPSRPDLARAIRRVVNAEWRFTGAADHLVSEAMYLDDPEGNGIEIYRDRPRSEWPQLDGRIQMASLPLDIDSILAETDEDTEVMAPGTTMGHVHLQVADLVRAEEFYCDVLGFEVTVRGYPGALFVSVGGYHHHLGLNTWAGEGAPPPPPGSRGLRRFEVAVPSSDEVEGVARRAESAGYEVGREAGGVTLSDPFSNRVLIQTS